VRGDEKKIRAHRAERIRGELRRRDLGAVLVVDPINLRDATGTRNMQVWTMHDVVRYALVFADGPTVLFDLATGRHLSAGLESVSDVRPLDGPEGVKLEQPVLIADRGPQVPSALPHDAADFQVPQTGPAHPRAQSRQDVGLSRLHPRAGLRSHPQLVMPDLFRASMYPRGGGRASLVPAPRRSAPCGRSTSYS